MTKRLIGLFSILIIIKLLFVVPSIHSKFFYEETNAQENDVVNNTYKQDDMIDITVYDNLPINKLAVDLNNDSKADNINWYQKGSEYYLFLPKGYDRNSLRVHFSDKDNVSVAVYDKDNKLIGLMKNNTKTNLFKNDKVILKTNINSKVVHSYVINVIQSDVASIYINLNNGDSDLNAINASRNHTTERPGYALVLDEDGNQIYADVEAMRGRGNRTWDKVKKPYQIKFTDKIDVLGMGKAKTYELLANVLDGPLSRNALFFEMAREFELPYAVDSKPVELYVNNNYMGAYLLTEKVQVKKNRIDVDDNEFLFEIENHPSGNNYVRTSRGTLITIKNPDFDDLKPSERAEVKRRALNYLNSIERKINGNTSDEELQKYIDYDSFAKHYWVQEISLNYDAMRGSNFFYTKDGKLYAGPVWDLDATLNRSWKYGSITGYYVLDCANLNSRIRGNWYRGLIRRSEFSNTLDKVLYDHYEELNNLPNTLNDYLDHISTSTKMNYIRRYFNTTISYRPAIPGNNTLAGSTNLMKQYLNQRINFYKGQYKNVLYTDLSYSYIKDGNEVEYKVEDINYIPNTNNIKIYGIDVYGNKKLIKEINDDNIGDVNFTLTSSTSSSRKRNNRINYSIKFERVG